MTEQNFTIEELNNEIWKTIPNFENYQVSNLGRIKSFAEVHHNRSPKLRKPNKNRGGYLNIRLCNKGIRRMFTIHKLVTLCFIGTRPKDTEVNHKNCIKTDNRIENLEYVTHYANMRHARDNNLFGGFTEISRQKSRERMIQLNATQETCKGEKQWSAKLTEKNVLLIRQQFEEGETIISLSKKWNVCYENLRQIVRRKTWTHI